MSLFLRNHIPLPGQPDLYSYRAINPVCGATLSKEPCGGDREAGATERPAYCRLFADQYLINLCSARRAAARALVALMPMSWAQISVGARALAFRPSSGPSGWSKTWVHRGGLRLALASGGVYGSTGAKPKRRSGNGPYALGPYTFTYFDGYPSGLLFGGVSWRFRFNKRTEHARLSRALRSKL